ncbi:uncharacterized protein LOC125677344 [Ostrea edulis]|uniref:uncharacterized protein LOC125677344 n=1 Tax=Ostrea edulis TaxID=37623 RepID=UPI0024AEF9AB|nr:uncharacterized protein LOC125677344 [Ostrea edulis]
MVAIWKVVYIGLVCLTVTCFGCDDVDTAACQRLAASKPDMCNDTCYASICKRYCGECPLKCYTCSDIESSQTCNSSTECSSKDYQCISAASFTNDFREVFKLGCAPSAVCSHYGKRSMSKRAGTSCCTSDLCNHNGGSKREIESKVKSTKPDVRRQSSSPVCADADNLACTLLFTVNTHMCNNDCIANQICPRLCGRCSECYECEHISSTENCTKSRVCDPGEVCYTLETLNFNLEHGYRLGCVHQRICDNLHTQASSIFGRRASGNPELSLTGGCCHGDLCNHHQLLPETTLLPTTSTIATTTPKTCHYYSNRCPFSNAYVYHDQCYHVGTRKMSWIQAKHYCESQCGHLATFTNSLVMERVLHSVISHHITSHGHDTSLRHSEIYVDAIDPAHNNHWIWESSLQSVPANMFYASSHQLTYCAATSASIGKLVAVDCSSEYLPLCQAAEHH